MVCFIQNGVAVYFIHSRSANDIATEVFDTFRLDLELAATCSVKLQFSLYFQIQA